MSATRPAETRVAAGPTGVAVGAMLGSRIAAALDDDDRQRAQEAQLTALDVGSAGAPVSWRNPDSGRHGTVVPGPAYRQGGATCRQFSHTVHLEGQPKLVRGTACRQPGGAWTPAS